MGDAGLDEPCQIYLAVPAGSTDSILAALLETGQIAALLLYGEDGAPAADAARACVPVAHGHGVPLIIADSPSEAATVGADGVHIPANEERYALARHMLGTDAIIGAGCATSRHDALVLAEQGADYVAFGPEPWRGEGEQAPELVKWWQEVCEPPVVGWHRGDWDDAAELIAAGADFIGVSALVWEAEDPAAALGKLKRMIEQRQRGNT